MQIDNATKKDINTLQSTISKLWEENPALEVRKYPIDDEPTNAKILEKLEAIERLLLYIFDGHVLIDGSFKKISNLYISQDKKT